MVMLLVNWEQHVAEQPQANRKNKWKVHDNYTIIPHGCCFRKAKQAFVLVKPAFLLNCTFKITPCVCWAIFSFSATEISQQQALINIPDHDSAC